MAQQRNPRHGSPPPAPTAQPAATAAPAAHAAPTGGGGRAAQAVTEAEQGSIILLFQTYRVEIAEWILDHVPGAQLLSMPAIAKMLPALALLFKIATRPGRILDVADDIAQEIAQALKEEIARRASGGAPGHAHTSVTAPAVPIAADPYTRFLFASMTTPNAAVFMPMMNWHDALSDIEKAQLYTLVGRANDKQLAALVKLPMATLKAAADKMPKEKKPMTYLQFCTEVDNDAALSGQVTIFLTSNIATTNGVDDLRFWKAVEHEFPARIKDKADFAQLMSRSPERIYDYLKLAPPPDPLAALGKMLDGLDNSPAHKSVEHANSVLENWIRRNAK